MDLETEFLQALIEQAHNQDVNNKLQTLSKKVSWAKGWPNNKKAFWNSEAFMWKKIINKAQREHITSQIQQILKQKGNNLDIGAGAYSYIKSVAIDISPKMLQLNENATEKIVGDIEKELLFKSNSFNSITAVFILNYVQNIQNLLGEVQRVLKKDGTFIVVLSKIGINVRHKAHQKQTLSKKEWRSVFTGNKFHVNIIENDTLWFFVCSKPS